MVCEINSDTDDSAAMTKNIRHQLNVPVKARVCANL